MDSGKFVTAGLVLRQTATKESDYILTVLTADGILSVIAKGARSRRSRYSAACQFLAYSELTVTKKGIGSISTRPPPLSCLTASALILKSWRWPLSSQS